MVTTPTAAFKDLCMDAVDAHRLGGFWAAVLGAQLVDHPDGDAHLEGDRPEDCIWVNAVPEPKTVRHRVRLDVAADLGRLRDLGAIVREGPGAGSHRYQMADVEHGEFCAVPHPGAARLLALVVEAVDPQRQARWWAEALGYPATAQDDGAWAVSPAATPFEHMRFVPADAPKAVKNRIHWDLVADDHADLLEAGAVVLREPDAEIGWWVLADPEDNEFCVFRPSR